MLAIIILPCDKAHAAAALTSTVASNRFERMSFCFEDAAMQVCAIFFARKKTFLARCLMV